MLIWIAGQLVTLAVVAWIAAVHTRQLSQVLNSWDAQIFSRIADHGYVWSTNADATASPAFFPGFPLLMRAVSWATGWPSAATGAGISVIAGVLFAYGLVRLTANVRGSDRTTGLLLVGLAAISPLSIVFLMPYTESLFCALAVWSLVGIVECRWLTAGGLALLAGLVRPTGPALAGALLVAVVVAFVHHQRSCRAAVAALVAPLGTIGYICFVGLKIGTVGAYFQAQKTGWGTGFDGGRSTLAFLYASVTTAPAVLDMAVVAVIGAALVLTVLLIRYRPPLSLTAYTVLAIATDVLCAGVMNSKVRLMIPAFPLLIPLAVWLRRQRPTVMILTGIGLASIGTWYSAYGLVIYPHAI